ncbi:MAG: hypothetical protein ACQGVC_23220 [Myxococcota bacterium]
MAEAGPDWKPCRAIVSHDDGRPDVEDDTAEFEIAGGRLLLVYFDERGAIIFEGREASDGRFDLLARSRPRKARVTLRGAVLEGRWHEGDDTGSMRIELSGWEVA